MISKCIMFIYMYMYIYRYVYVCYKLYIFIYIDKFIHMYRLHIFTYIFIYAGPWACPRQDHADRHRSDTSPTVSFEGDVGTYNTPGLR